MKRSFVAAFLFLLAGAVTAQPWPNQSVRLVVPFAPGGGVDTMARILAQPLAQRLGQSVAVDNRGGAGGNIGTEVAARSKPDGYTILMASVSPNAVNVHLYSKLPFDPIRDFEPVIYFSQVPNILVVAAGSPYNSARELIDFARANPNKVSYGSAGVGSSHHLAGQMLATHTGVQLMHVPYRGAGMAHSDLLAGTITLMMDTTAPVSFVAAGKMKALAVAADKRSPAFPQLPTFSELGIKGVSMSAWYGVMAPAGTPREIVDRLNTEINAVLKDPAVVKRLNDLGADIGGGTAQDFGRFVEAEIKRYADVVKAAGAKLD